MKEGDRIANGSTITLTYVKDDSQTQETKYTVRHVVAGTERDSQDYAGTDWVNAENPTAEIVKGSLAPKSYTGYKFASMSPADVKEGDRIANGSTITLTYVKDGSQTQDTEYTVRHSVGGKMKDVQKYMGTDWILEENPTVEIKEGSLKQNTYQGYKYTGISTNAKEGERIASKTVITLTYIRDDSQTKTLQATVDYNVGGTIREADRETLRTTVWINDPDVLSTESVRAKTYAGYHLNRIEVNGTRVENLAATVPANTSIMYYYDEDPDITITYVVVVEEGDTAHGKVTASAASTSPADLESSETLAPVTATAKGSTAVPAEGYRFVQWTDEAGRPVSDKAAFVPNKVNGLNVAATYKAHFAKRGDLKYEVHYFYENPAVKGQYIENEALKKIVTDAVFESAIPYATNETTWNERTYSFEKIEGATKVSVNADANILNVYYALDELGETEPGNPDKENPNRSDGIPDKYQIAFTYSAEANGMLNVSDTYKEVKTICKVTRDKTTNAIIEIGEVTPVWPTQQPVASPKDPQKYYLLKWTDDNNGWDLSRDTAQWKQTWEEKNFAGYTAHNHFTAHFEANPDNAWTVEKKVTNLPARGYFRVGEEARFDIIVTNSGNRPLKEIRVKELLDGARIVESGNRYTVSANGKEAVIENLALKETVVVKAVYVVTRSDLFNRNFVNEVITEGTIMNPDEPNAFEKDDVPASTGSVPAGAQGGGSGGGGGGGGGSSTRSPGAGGGAGGPGTVTIDPEAVPLANLPDMGNDDILALIDDEEVPLAALPKTGQTGSAALMLMLSSMMLAAFAVVTRKKEDEQ